MLQELSQIPAKLTLVELGVGLGVAVLLVEKIIGWISKLRGNGKVRPSCISDPAVAEAFKEIANSGEILRSVKDVHIKQCNALDGQTLVLDRIYQGQALQIKALDKIVEKLDRE